MTPPALLTRALPAALALAGPLLAGNALAQQPGFDCARASGSVEQLICQDASLAALDQRLGETFKAAMAKASAPLAKQLRGEQRGWIKGRNDCWKAAGQLTWITATWTVDSVPACVAALYRQRTAELQAVWQLKAPHTTAYACQNNPANEVIAHAFATDPATIRLERGDRSVTLWQVGAATAGTYEGQNVSLQQQGQQLSVNWLNTDTGSTEVLTCTAH